MSNRRLIELLMINKCFAKLYYYSKYFRKCAAHAYGRPAQSSLSVCMRFCWNSLLSLVLTLVYNCVFRVWIFPFVFVFVFAFCIYKNVCFFFISFVMILSIPALLSAIADTLCSLFFSSAPRMCFASVEREWRRNRAATKYGNTTINWNREIGIYASRGRLNAFYKKTYACNYRCIGRIFLGILWSVGFVFILIAKYAPIKESTIDILFLPHRIVTFESKSRFCRFHFLDYCLLGALFFHAHHRASVFSRRLSINLINVAHVI